MRAFVALLRIGFTHVFAYRAEVAIQLVSISIVAALNGRDEARAAGAMAGHIRGAAGRIGIGLGTIESESCSSPSQNI